MENRLALHVLASGSRGNAALVVDEATGAGVLIDCGVCKRDFFDRCGEAGFDPAKLAAILVTHDHTDHTKGLGVVLRGLAKLGIAPAVYVDDAVRAASKEVGALEGACDLRPFSAGDALSLAGMQVHAFRTSHDAAASCGFRLEAEGGDVVGFVTDTGIVTGEAHEGLAGARILALESNHDVQMLKDGPYPYPVKRRVGSDVGHLSNAQAADELGTLLHAGLEQVVAMHVSQNNNTYRLPGDSLAAVVARAGHGAVVQVAYQSLLVSAR
ncbi:MBL fold metallo-hydrolase [Arabiibacter massiliensis]|uniref:MBL fold metallo-hydrolase n=1 Tax=Arabiibacter massiliensis TaxID=1870985 RepID=UPI0009BA9862|nr:MBL fold metallo-hydrolase [Arabiibacter massiliensis]